MIDQIFPETLKILSDLIKFKTVSGASNLELIKYCEGCGIKFLSSVFSIKDAELLVKKGNELKIVYPQEDLDPRSFLDLDFDVFSLQPMDDSNYKSNLNKTLEYCTDNPIWRLSLQVHKYLQIP